MWTCCLLVDNCLLNQSCKIRSFAQWIYLYCDSRNVIYDTKGFIGLATGDVTWCLASLILLTISSSNHPQNTLNFLPRAGMPNNFFRHLKIFSEEFNLKVNNFWNFDSLIRREENQDKIICCSNTKPGCYLLCCKIQIKHFVREHSIMVKSLTGLDLIKQDDMLLFPCTKTST